MLSGAWRCDESVQWGMRDQTLKVAIRQLTFDKGNMYWSKSMSRSHPTNLGTDAYTHKYTLAWVYTYAYPYMYMCMCMRYMDVTALGVMIHANMPGATTRCFLCDSGTTSYIIATEYVIFHNICVLHYGLSQITIYHRSVLFLLDGTSRAMVTPHLVI